MSRGWSNAALTARCVISLKVTRRMRAPSPMSSVFCFGLFSFLFLARVFAQLVGQMSGDGFAFAIGIGREVDVVGRERQLLQLGENLFFSGNDDVLGFEIIFEIDTEAALGQVFHVAVRSIDRESLAQILLDSFRLSGRFDND